MNLTNDQISRYSRHLILPEVGVAGQEKRCVAKVLCIGSGGLGSPIILYLSAAGVGKLGMTTLGFRNDRPRSVIPVSHNVIPAKAGI